MGKANRQLQKAKNEYEKEIEQSLFHNNNDDEVPIHNHQDYDDIAYQVQTELSKFCVDNSYALCEYLDIENIENYINWIMKR